MAVSPALEALYSLVKLIPPGRVAAYGRLGEVLQPKVSGLLVGSWMSLVEAQDEIPWWRVVGADGALKTIKRSPAIGAEQRARLEDEGVIFVGDRIPMERYGWQP